MKLRNPFTTNSLPYSEQEIRDYLQDIERFTVLRNKSRNASMVGNAAEYDRIISNMQLSVSFMVEQNKNTLEDRKRG